MYNEELANYAANAEYQAALTDTAQKIWDIAKISPEHGNAVMDLLGDETYEKVMRLAND